MDIFRKLGATAFRNPSPRHRWVNVFVNGLYHGVYDLSEEVNAKWISDHDLSSLPNGASDAEKALYASSRYRVYRPSGMNTLEEQEIFSALDYIMDEAAVTPAPSTGSVANIPVWNELEKRLDMDNYIDSLIAITSAGKEIDNPTNIQQFLFRKVDDTVPPYYYWRARVANWDHSTAFQAAWDYDTSSPQDVRNFLVINMSIALTDHPRFKARFDARLKASLISNGGLTSSVFVSCFDLHRNALVPLVAADFSRWLRQPELGYPDLDTFYSPKMWLADGNSLRYTGADSFFLTNRTAYLQSLTASGHYVP